MVLLFCFKKGENMTQSEMEFSIKELEKQDQILREYISRTLELISKNTDQILELSNQIKLLYPNLR